MRKQIPQRNCWSSLVVTQYRNDHVRACVHIPRNDLRCRYTLFARQPALALRSRSEIFVEEGVLEKSKTLRAEGTEPDPERLKKWLEEVNPEDLGKYRM